MKPGGSLDQEQQGAVTSPDFQTQRGLLHTTLGEASFLGLWYPQGSGGGAYPGSLHPQGRTCKS